MSKTPGLVAGCVAFVLTGVSVVSGRQQQGPAPTGLILGRVVDAVAGTPVSGVVITAMPSADPATIPPSGRTQSMLTDPQGRFVFRNLPKGTYSLMATIGGSGYSPSGFIVTGLGHQIGAYLDGSYGQRRPGGPAQPIDLADGERVGDAVIRLWKGGAISGRVLDEAGEPLVDAVVSAVQRAADGRLLTGPTDRTDDRGVYRIGTLKPGAYVVVVPQTQILMPSSTIDALLSNPPDPSAPARFGNTGVSLPFVLDAGLKVGSAALLAPPQGRVTNGALPIRRADNTYAYQTTYAPSAASLKQATTITLRSGEDRSDVDVQLQPVRTVEVAGVLVDGSGPVPNFGIHLMPVETGDGASLAEVATAATDGQGMFTFPLVPSGSYTLLAVRTGPVTAPSPAPAAEARTVSEVPGAWASQSIEVGDSRVGNLVLTLRPGVRITGRVEFAGTGERPAADRLRQLAVTLTRSQPLFRSSATSLTPVDPGGAFAFRGVPPGRYVLGTRDAIPGWTLQAVTIGGRDVTDTALTLGDADLADVTVQFSDQPAQLTGTVASTASPTDLDSTVFVFPTDRARWADGRISARTFRTVRVSRAGTFTVAGLIPGEYFAVAALDEAAGDWPDARLLGKLAPLASTVRVDPNQKQTVQLRTVTPR